MQDQREGRQGSMSILSGAGFLRGQRRRLPLQGQITSGNTQTREIINRSYLQGKRMKGTCHRPGTQNCFPKKMGNRDSTVTKRTIPAAWVVSNPNHTVQG